MNERIKELYNQADKFAKENRTQTISGPGNNYFELFHEKFAELIVRECAKLIDNKVTITAAETYDEVFVAKYDTRELSAKQIKEHFGVEE
jgi:hypothetical protein